MFDSPDALSRSRNLKTQNIIYNPSLKAPEKRFHLKINRKEKAWKWKSKSSSELFFRWREKKTFKNKKKNLISRFRRLPLITRLCLIRDICTRAPTSSLVHRTQVQRKVLQSVVARRRARLPRVANDVQHEASTVVAHRHQLAAKALFLFTLLLLH